MTLIEQNPVSHLLDGMVKCRNCGTPMETAGESFNEASRYVCATKNKGCNTPDIEAGPFNRLVVRRAIHAFLYPGEYQQGSGHRPKRGDKQSRRRPPHHAGLDKTRP